MERKIYTTCTRDCPDSCGMIAHVKDGRLVKLTGHPEHGYTKGFLCQKANGFISRVYSQERQLKPLYRKGGTLNGSWVSISWEDALDLTAANIQQTLKDHGPLSILHLQRSGSFGLIKDLGRRFFNLLGGVTTLTGSLCGGAGSAAHMLDFNELTGHDPTDLAKARFLIIWGRNPAATGVHFLPVIKEVQNRGGQVILIDPIKTQTASYCDFHIAPTPGSDGELALAMAKIILEENLADLAHLEKHTHGFQAFKKMLDDLAFKDLCGTCGLSSDTVRWLATSYATTQPAAIYQGFGLNKYANSSHIFRYVNALASLTGQIGKSGGGSTFMYALREQVDHSLLAKDFAKHHRSYPEPQLARGILTSKEPPIHLFYINGANPVTQLPDANQTIKAFKQVPFVVLADQFLTDTADFAHLFLPVTTAFEEVADVVFAYGHRYLGGVNQVIPPLGEARTDLWIFQQLANRLGFGAHMAGSEQEWLDKLLLPLKPYSMTLSQILAQPVANPVPPAVPFKEGSYNTVSGKFEFVTEYVGTTPASDLYPLRLISSMNASTIQAQRLEKDHPDTPIGKVHPQTGEKYLPPHTKKALLRSPTGHLVIQLVLDESVSPHAVVVHGGTWIKKGGGVNRLTQDTLSDQGEMAAYFNTYVALESLTSSNRL